MLETATSLVLQSPDKGKVYNAENNDKGGKKKLSFRNYLQINIFVRIPEFMTLGNILLRFYSDI